MKYLICLCLLISACNVRGPKNEIKPENILEQLLNPLKGLRFDFAHFEIQKNFSHLVEFQEVYSEAQDKYGMYYELYGQEVVLILSDEELVEKYQLELNDFIKKGEVK